MQVYHYARDNRNVLVTPEVRARFLRLEPAERLGEPHAHDLGHEVFVVMSGRAEFLIDGETAVLGPGEMCVALAGQWHTVRAVDGPAVIYLSVTPHVVPTHTHRDARGRRLPDRYLPPSAYDAPEVDRPLEHQVAELGHLLGEVAERAQTLARRWAEVAERPGPEGRNDVYAQLRATYRALLGATRLWNEVAPRLEGGT